MHITDYEKVQQLVWNNVFILDGGDALGTKTIFARDLANALLKLSDSDAAVNAIKIMETEPATKLDKTARLLIGTADGNKTVDLNEGFFTLLDAALPVEMRKNFFRGKNLGSVVTNEQYARISDGTFKGFFIGDYWFINSVHWRIADINYWSGSGDTYRNTTPHLVIFPDEKLAESKMNETNTTTGGFINTLLWKGGVLSNINDTIIAPIFGNHIFTYRDYLSNAVTNGIITGGLWDNIKAMIPVEPMIFNTRSFSSMASVNTEMSLLQTVSHEQLSLLRLNGFFINPGRYWYWLRDVCNSTSFAFSSYSGCPDVSLASGVGGVRPVFGITG